MLRAAPPAPPPAPIVCMPPEPNPPPPDEWNMLPDPTTGQVDVYHQGGYVGSVTGDEPKDEDPPIRIPCSTQTNYLSEYWVQGSPLLSL